MLLRPAIGRPKRFPALSDAVAWLAGPFVVFATKALAMGTEIRLSIALLSLVGLVTQLTLGYLNSLYRARYRISTFREVRLLGVTWLTALVIACALAVILKQFSASVSVSSFVSGATITVGLQIVSRLIWRSHWESTRRPSASGARRALLFGGGVGGEKLLRSLGSDLRSSFLSLIHI